MSEYFRALVGESERAMVILAAGYLHDLLGDLLRSYFVEDENSSSDMLNNERPLSSFSARIRMAYLLGLITKEEKLDLDAIRRTRNEAAHLMQKVDFSEPSIPATQRCHSFQTLSERTKNSHPEPKQRYLLAAAWLAAKIAHSRATLVRRTAPDLSPDLEKLTRRTLALAAGVKFLSEEPPQVPRTEKKSE